MRVLALNSSPRPEGQSKTELMLRYLVAGMREAGAEVEVVDLRQKTVRNCIGCYTCWTKTPGVCVHQDDMTIELLPKWIDSDVAVYATPLYNYGVNATLKAFVERSIPAAEPFFEIRDGRMFHPLRSKTPGIVVLSVAGMPDAEHFAPLSAHMRYMLASPGRRLVAEIYRPSAELLPLPAFKTKADAVLAATTDAGREIVRDGAVSANTMARVTQPLIEPEEMVVMGNWMWRNLIALGMTPKESQEKGLVPRPDSFETFLLFLRFGFKPEGAAGTSATVRFVFSGEVSGECYFGIDRGAIRTGLGPSERADLTVSAPFGVWMDIVTGKAEGAKMFLEGKYRVEGDASLLMQMPKWFGR